MGVFLLCLHLALKPMESQLVTPTNLLASLIAVVQVKRSLLRFGIMVTRDLILTWRMHMVLKKAHYEVILLYNVVSATFFNILNYTFSNQKAHYEVIMNDKVLSLIKEAEAYYQELEKDRLVHLMPFHFLKFLVMCLCLFDKRKDLVIHYNFIVAFLLSIKV